MLGSRGGLSGSLRSAGSVRMSPCAPVLLARSSLVDGLARLGHDEDPRGEALRGSSSCLSARAPVGIRTPNLLIRSQMLYPLSYGRSFLRRRNPAMLAEVAPRQKSTTPAGWSCGHGAALQPFTQMAGVRYCRFLR